VSGRPVADTDDRDQNGMRAADPSPPWRSLAVVVGPSLLVAAYSVVGTLATIVGTLARPGTRSRRRLRTTLVGGALLPWAYLLLVRPWHSG
jgi:hypothetical protein